MCLESTENHHNDLHICSMKVYYVETENKLSMSMKSKKQGVLRRHWTRRSDILLWEPACPECRALPSCLGCFRLMTPCHVLLLSSWARCKERAGIYSTQTIKLLLYSISSSLHISHRRQVLFLVHILFRRKWASRRGTAFSAHSAQC